MDSIEAALEDLRLQDNPNIAATARVYNVQRSTLSRRFNGVTNPAKVANQNKQLLRPQQELELVEYINTLTKRGTLPTPAMVRNFAGDIAGRRPGRCWSHRFCTRFQDVLLCRYLKNIDISRKRADNPECLKAFYDLVKQKTEEYGVLPQNTYNMDEKGFMIGVTTKQRRIFTKEAFEKGEVLANNQDGNRQWITIVATVCADRTWIPLGVIFAGNIRDTWLQDKVIDTLQAHISSTTNGWTDDQMGLYWLQQIFDRYTKPRARNGRDWRLLFTDGHSSHLNMEFIKWCDKHYILLAIYPPHSTHRLQPLDVSLFSPLATFYGQELDGYIHETRGLCGITKRDFLRLFWPAFIKAFSQSNIESGWRKTGLYPLDSTVVLSKLTQQSNGNKVDISRPVSNQSSSSSAISASDWRKIRALLQEVTNEAESKKVQKLNNTITSLTTRIVMLNRDLKGLTLATN
jgi:hypothetical protein